ncbi:MAG: ATP-dependent helicase [Methanomassiliicoccaceae archaeon]|nr:ATP-dependent helicase [Methanomassiliicoccaceae archaeon]
MTTTDLNEDQKRIASTVDGIVVVDAGPGTGKTHTIVHRYMNILRKDVDPADILLLTFTNNAAAEMEERVKAEMTAKGLRSGSVRSSTFDSFCMKVVMESPETVRSFFKTKETLTRGAGLVQNETLDHEYFRSVYTRFIRKEGRRYGTIPAVIGTSCGDVYEVIQQLMSIGMAPLHDGEWFGRDKGVLLGKDDELIAELTAMDDLCGKYRGLEKLPPERMYDTLTEENISEAVRDPRKELLEFVHDVYYEFIRSSISDNRLTFGLNALFAFITLHENKNIRNLMSFRYVMIDEFQDTNELQFMISLLILKEPNLCVVGDWKQGIYGFRYATIENITEFDERLREMRSFLNRREKRVVTGIEDAVRLQLTENYRSTQPVIDASFRALGCKGHSDEPVVAADVTELISVRPHDRTRIERLCAAGKDEEILAILEKINEYVTSSDYMVVEHGKDGIRERRPQYGDIAVLCRTGEMCIRVKETAERYGIPAHLQGDVDIMDSREGKLVLAWLRFINNRNDRRGPVTILTDMGYCLAEMNKMFPKGKNSELPADIEELRKILRRKRRRINDLLTTIFDHHGLNNDISQSIISTVAAAHSGSMLTVSDVIRMIESDMDRRSRYGVDALLDGRSVMVQTMHKSKGLEYPIVIIGGLNVRTMPLTGSGHGHAAVRFDPLHGIRMTQEYVILGGHHKVFEDWKWRMVRNAVKPDYDGERRLFFVALSRAKQYITMTCRKKKESFFIKDIGGEPMRDVDPRPDMMPARADTVTDERPRAASYERRKRRVPLHEIMGRYEESGGGKGTEFGVMIHKEAQRIMTGMSTASESDETAYLRKIYDSVKDAKIMTEVDCFLPVREMIIAGRIDMLAEFDDRVEIHDYKTDMNMNNGERYRVQLSVYAHAAKRLGKRVVCVIDYVSQGISVPVEIMSMDEIYEHTERMADL